MASDLSYSESTEKNDSTRRVSISAAPPAIVPPTLQRRQSLTVSRTAPNAPEPVRPLQRSQKSLTAAPSLRRDSSDRLLSVEVDDDEPRRKSFDYSITADSHDPKPLAPRFRRHA